MRNSEALTRTAFVPSGDDPKKLVINKELLGQDAMVLAEAAGVKVPAETLLLFGETSETHPFVDHEQMMPFVPFVRVPDGGPFGQPGPGTLTIGDAAALGTTPRSDDLAGLTFRCFGSPGAEASIE